ncbi:OB-fold protein [Polaribacter uvawellassae]|uniref:OB-fold protein n=1 Tax=Polaribacter uvawellassae TaxID=3133495 RepID=UPI00321C055E
MAKRNIFLLILISILLIISMYLYFRVSKEATINIVSATTSYKINSEDLVSDFITEETLTNKKFAGKIIEIKGKVKEISFLNNTNTVILFGNENSGIICDFNKNQTEEIKALTKNQTVIIKGICKGFLKDVILLNCLLITKQKDE